MNIQVYFMNYVKYRKINKFYKILYWLRNGTDID